MTDLKRLFDPYSRRARLYPALLTLLPILVALLAWLPALESVGTMLIGLAGACGVLFLLGDIARTTGKAIERRLVASWGGWPSTIWLRHSDFHLSKVVKRRYHDFFARRLGELMPTEEEERVDPESADERYAACTTWLKEQCRGSVFPLLEEENATYGFRRNLLGLKPIGIAICIAALVMSVVLALISGQLTSAQNLIAPAHLRQTAPVIGAVLLSLMMLTAWIFAIRASWVRDAGDQYARALLACCDTLSAPQGNSTS